MSRLVLVPALWLLLTSCSIDPRSDAEADRSLSYHHFSTTPNGHETAESWGCAGTSPTYLGPGEPKFEEVQRHAKFCENLMIENGVTCNAGSPECPVTMIEDLN